MKTVQEFVQRLRNDPQFEQMAQSYDKSDEFIHFIKSEGYDFTLDQLLDEFKNRHEALVESEEEPPVPIKTVEEFIQRLQNDPEFEQNAQSFENNDAFMEFVRKAGYDFTLDQLMEGFKQQEVLTPQAATAPPPQDVPPMPTSPAMDTAEVQQAVVPSLNQTEAEHKLSRTLSPKFEGISGGRRRAMKWQYVDSDKT